MACSSARLPSGQLLPRISKLTIDDCCFKLAALTEGNGVGSPPPPPPCPIFLLRVIRRSQPRREPPTLYIKEQIPITGNWAEGDNTFRALSPRDANGRRCLPVVTMLAGWWATDTWPRCELIKYTWVLNDIIFVLCQISGVADRAMGEGLLWECRHQPSLNTGCHTHSLISISNDADVLAKWRKLSKTGSSYEHCMRNFIAGGCDWLSDAMKQLLFFCNPLVRCA